MSNRYLYEQIVRNRSPKILLFVSLWQKPIGMVKLYIKLLLGSPILLWMAEGTRNVLDIVTVSMMVSYGILTTYGTFFPYHLWGFDANSRRYYGSVKELIQWKIKPFIRRQNEFVEIRAADVCPPAKTRSTEKWKKKRRIFSKNKGFTWA